MTPHETIYEISGAQLEAIINYYAASPNIESMELDQVHLDKDGHLMTIYSTIMYRNERPIQHVLEATEDFPEIGETK